MSKNIYLLITVAIEDDADPDKVHNECDFALTHPNILEYELLGWREEEEIK